MERSNHKADLVGVLIENSEVSLEVHFEVHILVSCRRSDPRTSSFGPCRDSSLLCSLCCLNGSLVYR